jgi:hypothetical protein
MEAMTHRALLTSSLIPLLACGPAIPKGDSDGDDGSGGSGDIPASTGELPDPTTLTATAPTVTGDPESTGDLPDPTEGTSGDPATCFPGQPPWSLLSSAEFDLPEELAAVEQQVMAPMSDGNVAIAVRTGDGMQQWGVLLIVSPAGEIIKTVETGKSTQVRATRLMRDGDGLVLLSLRVQDGVTGSFLTRFAADGSLLGEVPLERPLAGGDFEIAGTDALVVGVDRISKTFHLARFDIDSGALLFDREFGAQGELTVNELAIDEGGDIFLAGGSALDDEGAATLQLWRVTATGEPVWHQGFGVPRFEFINDLALAPDGLAVVARSAVDDRHVDVLAFDREIGAQRWEIAFVGDADADLDADIFHVDDGAIALPLMRATPGKGTPQSVEVARISFTGALLETVLLPQVPALPTFNSAVLTARGDCGEMVLLAGHGDPLWLGSFTP